METSSAIEAEIKELSRQIEEKRRMLEESRGVPIRHEEAINEVVSEHLKIDGAVLGSTTTQATDDDAQNKATTSTASSATTHQHYLDNAPPQVIREVNDLIELVPTKGVKAAIALAQQKDPFTLDAFHDALVDRLYHELKARGYLK